MRVSQFFSDYHQDWREFESSAVDEEFELLDRVDRAMPHRMTRVITRD